MAQFEKEQYVSINSPNSKYHNRVGIITETREPPLPFQVTFANMDKAWFCENELRETL